MNIHSVGEAIHEDFFTVAGADFPADAELEFNTAVGPVPVKPDFKRPHLLLVCCLRAAIPVGDATLRVTSESAAAASNEVAVTVTAEQPRAVRVLHAGESKPRPYTIALVANPALASEALSTPVKADPILMNRAGYHAAVGRILDSLFRGAEDLLREGDIDEGMRLVSVFAAAGGATEARSLVTEGPDSSLTVRREMFAPFLSAAGGIEADVVVAITGSTTNESASAYPTTDHAQAGGVAYTFDEEHHIHGRFPLVPGCFVINERVESPFPTEIHEFCHAASEESVGWVTDMKIGAPLSVFKDKLLINLKFRDAPGGPVPAEFARYNGTAFPSNPTRAPGVPYPAAWRAYHPRLIDGDHRNLMDDYTRDPTPLACRLDALTRAWLRDRLDAKLSR